MSGCLCGKKCFEKFGEPCRPLWPVRMDVNYNGPTDERRKLVKTYKKVCSLENILATEVYGKTYSKTDDRKIGVAKTYIHVK